MNEFLIISILCVLAIIAVIIAGVWSNIQKAQQKTNLKRKKEELRIQKQTIATEIAKKRAVKLDLEIRNRILTREQKVITQHYVENRIKEADRLNHGLAKRDSDFKKILKKSLMLDHTVLFESLKVDRGDPDYNQDIDAFEKDYKNGDSASIIKYSLLVLERSEYPGDFPKEHKVAYVPEPKELVVEYRLPAKNIVPNISEYRYIKTRDAIDEKPRKPSEIKEIYQDVVAAICLRTLHELFEADQGNCLNVIVFNGYVQAVNPTTGKDIRPYLVSIRVTKDRFKEINLAGVDKQACLRNLGAQVSPQPDELIAVKPVIEFDMVDKRFVEENDVISALDARSNLMDLNPFEFENLVNNLFSKMGFEAKLTRSSRDGGIDVVAFDPRPILGGKVVIQAKRYKNVVGVSAVRDLYGSMINEGAGKGILVTTSHYGADAYDFAKDKPIELIDGGGLLYLLEQNGYKARIIFPQD